MNEITRCKGDLVYAMVVAICQCRAVDRRPCTMDNIHMDFIVA